MSPEGFKDGVASNVGSQWLADQTPKRSGLANIDICSSNGILRKGNEGKLNEIDSVVSDRCGPRLQIRDSKHR